MDAPDTKFSPLEYRLFFRRYLPHIQPPGATLFVNFRLAGSLPPQVLEQLATENAAIERRLSAIPSQIERQHLAVLEEKRAFARWDALLDRATSGPMWLRDPRVAGCVAGAIHYHDGRTMDLDSFCIMANHVHVLLTPLQEADGSFASLQRIIHSIKSFSGHQADQLLGLSGRFWQPGYYDHYARDPDELARIRMYILANPVKAGLVERPSDWPWSYCKYGIA